MLGFILIQLKKVVANFKLKSEPIATSPKSSHMNWYLKNWILKENLVYIWFIVVKAEKNIP